jgi:hypothetical protein
MSEQDQEQGQPSTELELVNQRVAWLRAELDKVGEVAQRAVETRKVGPLDEWISVLKDYDTLGQALARTDFVPKDFRGKPEQVTAAMMYGREIGLPPLTTLQNTHVIHGRVGMYAEQLRAMILAAGHEYEIEESTSDRCVIAGRRKGSDRWISHTYTMDQAKLAGLYAQNEQYRKRPTEMLLARGSAIMAHAQFPDVIRGMGALEEMEAGEEDTPPAVEPKPAASTVQRKPRAKAKALDPAPAATAPVIPAAAGLPPLPGEETGPENVTDPPARRTEADIIEPRDRAEEELQDTLAGMRGDDPVEDPGSGPVPDKPKPIGTAQTKMLQARFRQLGYTDEPDDREARLSVASVLAGAGVTTFRANQPESMTYDQSQEILKGLAECRNRDDVLELMVRLSQDQDAEAGDGGPES